MEDNVKLLYVWGSPYVMRAVAALELKEIEYEKVEEDIKNKSELLLQSNPVHKKVPVLIHNGRSIAESKVIIEYIDETWPDKYPFLPRGDPFARAQARFWADFVQTKIFTVAADIVFRGGAKEEFIKNCRILDEQLKKKNCSGDFFAGNEMRLVDIMLVPTALCMEALVEVGRLRFPSRDECPHFLDLLDAIRRHSVIKSSLPDPGKLKEFFSTAFQWIKNLD